MFIEYFMIVITSILIVITFYIIYLNIKLSAEVRLEIKNLNKLIQRLSLNNSKHSGYELCDGSKLQLDKYPLLKKYFEENKIPRWKNTYYKLLKLLGINTFKLPDLRDQFIKSDNQKL